jgi:serine/threonine protein phosphatase 1
MITYVIPDLHGRYDLLAKALQKIGKQSDEKRVISLGDYIDRGPDSNLIAGAIRSNPIIPLKGNHEEMMSECFDEESYLGDGYHWFSNGGKETWDSYQGDVSGMPLG